MRNDTPDRQRMHQDLRELAKLAETPAPGSSLDNAHAFESAESSGYVDLSAYQADDESWIERELARGKAGPTSSQRAIDGLSPQSMAPVALEALLAADEKLEEEEPTRRRWPLALAGIVSAAAVAALAMAVMRNAPHTPRATQAAAAAPPPAATQPVATPEPAATTAPTQTTESAPQAASATAVASATHAPSEPASRKPRGTHATRWRGHASSPAGVAAAKPAATHRVVIPTSHAAQSSGDSLMDAIRASVKK